MSGVGIECGVSRRPTYCPRDEEDETKACLGEPTSAATGEVGEQPHSRFAVEFQSGTKLAEWLNLPLLHHSESAHTMEVMQMERPM